LLVKHPYWSEYVKDPWQGRVAKPRISGLTLVVDNGISLHALQGILQMAEEHIDYWKFGAGTQRVCPAEVMLGKVTLCEEYGVKAYPGGTLLEIAVKQGCWQQYIDALHEDGIGVIEISDGSIEIPLKTRRDMIRYAKKLGMTVFTEIGYKVGIASASTSTSFNVPAQTTFQDFVPLIQTDINLGADYVGYHVPGMNLGIETSTGEDSDCSRSGGFLSDEVLQVADRLSAVANRIIWQTGSQGLQAALIERFGLRANVGNVSVHDALYVESLRRGFHAKTVRSALHLPSTRQDEYSPPQDSFTATGHGNTGAVTSPKIWTKKMSATKRGSPSTHEET